jgi:hypothetical protein
VSNAVDGDEDEKRVRTEPLEGFNDFGDEWFEFILVVWEDVNDDETSDEHESSNSCSNEDKCDSPQLLVDWVTHGEEEETSKEETDGIE